MKFTELKKHIEGGAFKPAYLITGADEYLKRSACRRFVALGGDCPDFNVSTYRDNYTAQTLYEALASLPLLGGRRVVIAYNCTFDLKPLHTYLSAKTDENTPILLFVGDITPNFAKLIRDMQVEPIDCGRLPDSQLLNFIASKTAAVGASITTEAARALITATGGFLTRMDVELKKLADYKSGGEITKADVEALVEMEVDYKIYELGDAIVSGDGKKAEQILISLNAANSPAAGTLSYLYKHFRRLLFIRLNPDSDTLASDLGIAEYAVKMSLRQASKLSPRKLKAAVDDLNTLNYDFRAGRISDKNALTLFVYKTLGIRPGA